MLDGAEEPLVGAGGIQGRLVRQVDLVEEDRILGWAGALVLHGPAYGVRVATHGRRLRGDRRHHQVRRRREQNGDRPRLPVVVVQLVGIVRIDVDVERALEHLVERVGPGGDEELPGDVRWQRDCRGLGVAVGGSQHAGIVAQRARVGDGRQEHVALAGPWALRVVGQPDRVGPVADVGGREPLVGDGVADRDRATVVRLIGRRDFAGDQVRGRQRVDGDRHRVRVVALVGGLVDHVARIGVDDEVGGPREPVGDRHVAGGRLVGAVRLERRLVGERAQQGRGAVQSGLRRKIDAVAPVRRCGRDVTLVDHREIERDGPAGVGLRGGRHR